MEAEMLGYLIDWFGRVLERAEYVRRDAYLAACVDISELERRMRCYEADA
jgi:hypothetical protein